MGLHQKQKSLEFSMSAYKDSSQTGTMPMLIWVIIECPCHFVGFVMHCLISWFFFINTCYRFVVIIISVRYSLQICANNFVVPYLNVL